ncbi:MAG: beta-ketoacyl reductase, partial [Cyanobacteria bacterium J06649_5]
WANAGMAAELTDNRQDRLTSRGVHLLDSSVSLKLLGQLMALPKAAMPTAQVGVCAINWEKFMGQLPPGVALPVLSQFSALSTDTDRGDRLQGLAKLRQVPAPERRQQLMQQIQAEIADVLGYNHPEEIAPNQPLSELGVDSLMAVELANQLEYDLGPTIPASFLFEHPTLVGLVDYLIEQMPELDF